MRALIVLVAACAHREAPPPPAAPLPFLPPTIDAAVSASPDAPPIPTASGSWDKHEVDTMAIAPPPPEAVRSAIHGQLAAMKRCSQDRTLLMAKMPWGVTLTIAPDGHVTKVKLHGGDRYTDGCVQQLLEQLQFPSSPDAVVVDYPFTE